MGPYLLGRGRTAVCYSSPVSIERAYCGMVEEAFSLTGLLRGEGLEGLCWERGGGVWAARMVAFTASVLSRVLAAP